MLRHLTFQRVSARKSYIYITMFFNISAFIYHLNKYRFYVHIPSVFLIKTKPSFYLICIGYGNTVPKTITGRMFLIVYATIGIPLMAMTLTTFGDKLKHAIRLSITSFERKILKRNQHQNIQRKSLIAVFVITVVFLCSISAISATVENWDFSLALYVWFVTFTTIGFGDYVPQGTGKKDTLYRTLEITYALIAFFLGLVLIATILHALSDWVDSKKPPTTDEIMRSLNRVTNYSLSTHKEESTTNTTES